MRNGAQTGGLFVGEAGLEHPLEEDALPGVVEVVELELEGEAAHDGGVEVGQEVGRADHHALEVLHLVQELIHLRDLPALLCAGAVLDEPVDLVEEENRVFLLGFRKGGLDVVLRAADPHREQVAAHLDHHLGAKRLAEVLHEFRLARPGRPPEKEVHAEAVGIAVAVLLLAEPPHGPDNAVERDVAADVEPFERVVRRGLEAVVGLLRVRVQAHEFAVRLHEAVDEFRHLLLFWAHPLHVLKDHRDAPRARLVFFRELLRKIGGDQFSRWSRAMVFRQMASRCFTPSFSNLTE